MSRIALVSQEFDFEKNEWNTVEEIATYSVDDEDEAKKEAADQAAITLGALVGQYEEPKATRIVPLPWRDRVIVCPLLDDGTPEVGAKTFSITVEVE